jgi:AraC-like DNA-binding protein/mannose-6-phosphate isomerase-like protein (cupin superfamily)
VPQAFYQPFPMLPGRRGQIWRHAPAYRRPRHFHQEPELNLVAGGSATFASGRSTFPVVAGDLLYWPPGCDHELLAASSDLDLFVFAVTPELGERILSQHVPLALSAPVQTRLPESTAAALSAQLLAPVVTREAAVAEQHVAELWREAHGSRLLAERPGGLGARVLRSLLQQPELDRRDRARLLHAHPSELSHSFRRSFERDLGLSLNAYRTRLRLLRFVDLVDEGGRTLLSAALEAGFGSYSQCHRVFSATIGCSPRAFFGTSLRAEMEARFAPLE